jgi:hypothetical protein
MDLALSSSTVLGAAVLVWLLWVAPYFLRRRRSARAAGEGTLLMEAADTPSAGGEASAPVAPGEGGTPRSADEVHATAALPPLRIRWRRLAIALAGLTALLGALVTLGLTLVGVPGWVPAACAAVAAGAVAVLRSLALRERKKRVDEAFREAMRANAVDPAPVPAARTATEVFDAGREPDPAGRALSREELRAMALEVAKASQASAAEAAKASGESESEWEPVDVPKPSYLDAAKAERAAPESLALPADPKPEGRPVLKPRPETPEPGAVPGVPAIAPRPAGRTGALGNLDEVLQRRRA